MDFDVIMHIIFNATTLSSNDLPRFWRNDLA